HLVPPLVDRQTEPVDRLRQLADLFLFVDRDLRLQVRVVIQAHRIPNHLSYSDQDGAPAIGSLDVTSSGRLVTAETSRSTTTSCAGNSAWTASTRGSGGDSAARARYAASTASSYRSSRTAAAAALAPSLSSR